MQKISKQSKRVDELKTSFNEYEKRIDDLTNIIHDIKNSSDYKSCLEIKSKLDNCESEEKQIRHNINDEFTKISRPLGKFVHISAHDKELKETGE